VAVLASTPPGSRAALLAAPPSRRTAVACDWVDRVDGSEARRERRHTSCRTVVSEASCTGHESAVKTSAECAALVVPALLRLAPVVQIRT
jgi:hypothetical protein